MTPQMFELLADVLPEPMLLVAPSGQVHAANEAMRRMLGAAFVRGRTYSVFEIFGTPAEQIKEYLKLCSGVRQFIPCAFKLSFYGGMPFDLRCEGASVIDQGGFERSILLRFKIKPAAVETFMVLNEQIAALNREIGRRKQIEEINRWLIAIVDSSDDAIISKDLNGTIMSCNAGASRLFGYEVPELIGKLITLLIPPDRQNEERDILTRIRRGERIEQLDTVRRRKDGSLIEVSLTISPIKDIHGKIMGASTIARDITVRRRAEQKLNEALQREIAARKTAEAANRAKDDFLASLSHELRTPLNPVLLIASDGSENPSFTGEVRESFETIRKNVELEARLIDDLLDLTRITYGKLALHMCPLNIEDILRASISTVQSDLNEKRINLITKWQAPSPSIVGDEVRLQQVFWNVLRNAVKFTPSGGEITIETRTDNGNFVVIISDTGIGMTRDEVGKIFEAFSQGEHARDQAHHFGGLGLGLAITRRLVELHSGQIRACSPGRGHGATFTIELPMDNTQFRGSIGAEHPPHKMRSNEVLAKGASILLIEDHEPTLVALGHLLTRRNYKVLSAANAAEARARAAQEKIDFVISDIGLPDGNGTVLMNELRQRYGLKGIALTGYGMEKDIEECLASGFIAHLVKPVNISALEVALERFNIS